MCHTIIYINLPPGSTCLHPYTITELSLPCLALSIKLPASEYVYVLSFHDFHCGLGHPVGMSRFSLLYYGHTCYCNILHWRTCTSLYSWKKVFAPIILLVIRWTLRSRVPLLCLFTYAQSLKQNSPWPGRINIRSVRRQDGISDGMRKDCERFLFVVLTVCCVDQVLVIARTDTIRESTMTFIHRVVHKWAW